MLAISRLAAFHPYILSRELHTVVLALVYEVRNLRSSVARSAIYTLGDLLVKMKKQIEPVCFPLTYRSNIVYLRVMSFTLLMFSFTGYGCDWKCTSIKMRGKRDVHSGRYRQSFDKLD